jgi:hypothetical protein
MSSGTDPAAGRGRSQAACLTPDVDASWRQDRVVDGDGVRRCVSLPTSYASGRQDRVGPGIDPDDGVTPQQAALRISQDDYESLT